MVQQIVLFFVLTLVLTVILAGGQEATGLLAGQVILAPLAPGLAGVILALIFRKNAPGLNFSVEGITLKSVMGAVLLPLGAALIVLLIATLITRSVINDTPFMMGMALVWVVIAPGIVMMNRQTFLKAPRESD